MPISGVVLRFSRPDQVPLKSIPVMLLARLVGGARLPRSTLTADDFA